MKKNIPYEIALLSLTFITLYSFIVIMPSCDTQEQVQPEAQHRCTSRVAGSRPHCWEEIDWKVFCQRVTCKPTPTQEQE